MGGLNGPVTKNRVSPVTTIFFRKFCFCLRTFNNELNWYTKSPYSYFSKALSFIWGCFSLWVSLNTICTLQQLRVFFNDFFNFAQVFFSIRVFFHGHWRLTGQQGKGGDHVLFHSTTSTRSRTFRLLFCNFARVIVQVCKDIEPRYGLNQGMTKTRGFFSAVRVVFFTTCMLSVSLLKHLLIKFSG